MGGLQAGVAKVDITPPVGTPMGGFAARPSASEGVHDPLYAKALALVSDDKKAILIAADILSIPKSIVDRVRESVQTLTNVDKEGIMIAGTHTHSGPDIKGMWADLNDSYNSAYLGVLGKYLSGVAYMAWRNMTGARIGSGKGEAVIGFNRRKRDGPIDREVGVIRIDDAEGNPRAAVVNYACHAVVLGSGNVLISADYPGYVNGILERVKGSGFVSMFTNGAAGNINPLSSLDYECPGTFSDAERLGSIVAGEALKTLEQTETTSDVQIWTSAVTQRLSAMKPSLAEAEQRISREQQRGVELRERGATPTEIAQHEAMLRYFTKNFNRLKEETARDRELVVETQVIRVNDTALVAAPGELFVEIGREIKTQSNVKNTFIIGYANGSIGYIPTLKAFEEGGYEPTRTWWNRVTRQAGELIKETSLKQLKAMQKEP